MEENLIEAKKKIIDDFRTKLLMEIDNIDNLMVGSFYVYARIIDFAVKKGFKRVIDIGCASAIQSILCDGKIEYIGLDSNSKSDRIYANINDVTYLGYNYPITLFETFKEDLAISVLAIRLAMLCK